MRVQCSCDILMGLSCGWSFCQVRHLPRQFFSFLGLSQLFPFSTFPARVHGSHTDARGTSWPHFVPYSRLASGRSEASFLVMLFSGPIVTSYSPGILPWTVCGRRAVHPVSSLRVGRSPRTAALHPGACSRSGPRLSVHTRSGVHASASCWWHHTPTWWRTDIAGPSAGSAVRAEG